VVGGAEGALRAGEGEVAGVGDVAFAAGDDVVAGWVDEAGFVRVEEREERAAVDAGGEGETSGFEERRG
jgi:hypothetical protein